MNAFKSDVPAVSGAGRPEFVPGTQRPIGCWASRITQILSFSVVFEAEAHEREGEGGAACRLPTDLDFPVGAGNSGHTLPIPCSKHCTGLPPFAPRSFSGWQNRYAP